jgi:hypothetical protein
MPSWISGFFDKTDPTKSMKHLAYAVAVCSATCWLSYDLFRSPMTANWVAAYAAFLAAVVTGKIAGKDETP